jgi:hypothetical protein
MKKQWMKIGTAFLLVMSSVCLASEPGPSAEPGLLQVDTSSRTPAAAAPMLAPIEEDKNAYKYQVNEKNHEPLVVIYSAETWVIRE